MTELVKRGSDDLAAKMNYAKALAPSDLLPKQYRDKPANVLIAVEYGEALGLAPMAAIQGIHVVEGKPTASAQLIGALVRNAGHLLRVTGNDTQAVAQIVRRDDPEFTFEAVWTMDRAKAAGLTGKQVWKQYPAAMLKARAITEVARDACPEVLSGVAYTAEELEPVAAPAVSAARLVPEGSTATVAPVAAPEPEAEVIEDAEIVEDEPEGITPAQRRKLFAELKRVGMATKDDGLGLISEILGRDVDSTEHLDKGEASMLIDNLAGLPDAEVTA